jgi:protein-S-isoprenylcysteine O-methyltransferase Ste14
MWVWIVIAIVFLIVFSRVVRENTSSTRSTGAAFIASLADGVALILLTLGVFGLLLALVFGLLPGQGPRLAGESLYATFAWSIGMVVVGVLLILASVAIRRMGGRSAPAMALRGGH